MTIVDKVFTDRYLMSKLSLRINRIRRIW